MPVASFGWVFWGFQDVTKQQEITRNKEKMTKKMRKKKPKNGQQKPPRCCGGFCWPFLTIKLGIFLEILAYAHQSRLQPQIYTRAVQEGRRPMNAWVTQFACESCGVDNRWWQFATAWVTKEEKGTSFWEAFWLPMPEESVGWSRHAIQTWLVPSHGVQTVWKLHMPEWCRQTWAWATRQGPACQRSRIAHLAPSVTPTLDMSFVGSARGFQAFVAQNRESRTGGLQKRRPAFIRRPRAVVYIYIAYWPEILLLKTPFSLFRVQTLALI